MITKKADIYFIGNIEQRITITLEGDVFDNFNQIRNTVFEYGNGQKLHSIYFREEETK